MSIKAAILTVSDRCSAGVCEDKSGAIIRKFMDNKGFEVMVQSIVSDDKSPIKEKLENWCDVLKLDLIITSGGTGFTSRDVTPEVTKTVIDREASIHLILITESFKLTPMAMLSRLTSGIRKSTLIINFPGSAKACKECLEIIDPVLQHAIDQLRDDRKRIDETHSTFSQNDKSKVKLESVCLRARVSPFKMKSMNEAILFIVNESSDFKETEMVDIKDLDKITSRILATDIVARIPLPPFRASIKDGYAVIAEDGCGPRKLIPMPSTAGSFAKNKIESGFCIRVSTGAPIPDGANAVVQVEDTKVIQQTLDGEEDVILIDKIPSVGEDIRAIGSDISVDGKPILTRFTLVGPIQLGLLASVGVNQVLTFRRPIVSVLSTGDEIIDAGQQLPDGAVWDSNRPTLLSLLKMQSIATIDLGIAKDDVHDIYNRIKHGLSNSDIIITSGGVSMGEKDLLKQIIEIDFDGTIHFGRVNLKPGKPTTFATCVFNGKKKYIFALPGNPVSAYVTFYLFVLPAINILSGKLIPESRDDICAYHSTINVTLSLNKEFLNLDERPEFARAILSYGDNNVLATITGNQRSSRLMSAKDANALVLLPSRSPQKTSVRNGEIVKAILL